MRVDMESVAMRKAKDVAPVAAPLPLAREELPLTTKVVLSTRMSGPLQALTASHDDLFVDAYPVGPRLLLECHGPPEDLERARYVLGSTNVLHESPKDGRMTIVLDADEAEEQGIAFLTAADTRVIPPVRWQGGEARVTLLVEDAADLRSLPERFPDARLLSKRAFANESSAREALGSPLFLPALTAKQARSLLAAFEAGYYEFPRRATTDEISTAVGIARSTFQQHLNRAEHHVVRAMLPLVRMRAEGPEGESARARDEALATYSRFSRELGLYVQLEILGDRVSGLRLTRAAHDGGGASHPYLTRILEHVRTGAGDLSDIPLHLEVGPFDREVLEFLRKLPRGQTVTYGAIARLLGRPRAARAVGQAVARNPVPVVIPCHRVLPASGGIGNYSGGGGAETKRTLLEREGALSARIPKGSRSRVARATTGSPGLERDPVVPVQA